MSAAVTSAAASVTTQPQVATQVQPQAPASSQPFFRSESTDYQRTFTLSISPDSKEIDAIFPGVYEPIEPAAATVDAAIDAVRALAAQPPTRQGNRDEVS